MIIAIDGPSGAGKSTVAKEVSKKLNFEYIDTGAMYRALAYKSYKIYNEVKEEKVDELLKDSKIDFHNNTVYLDGENVNDYIRTETISKMASEISAIENVRNKMVELQREISKNKNVILDGRDIGTKVFPNADYKFYITASVEERAKRRFNELKNKNKNIKFENILEDIKKRDENDTTRRISPLKMAEDAVLIDTTDMSMKEVTNFIVNYIGGFNVL